MTKQHSNLKNSHRQQIAVHLLQIIGILEGGGHKANYGILFGV